ncbi:MAG TPA: class A beta-lactamase-related serine hydrolase [Ferruginibacter sp.]|nr:class A beta-lactamase-related serine hydrolase [Ferruginibacter sp.]HRE62590.1 class A beta-lactamase-related serine hydrolase [Ferruginibacter sp.]
MRILFTTVLIFYCCHSFAQHYKEDKKLSKAIANILAACKLDSAYDVQESHPAYVGVAILPLHKKNTIGGVHYKNFIYPASMYKLYVAMEILKQVNEQKIDLYKPYEVRKPNDVDRSKEIVSDPRPLLKAGDTVNVHYLLDLMITRSDNTAANCLIDIAGRKNINKTIDSLSWKGSEVTRKFLNRKWEDPGYDTIRGTFTSAFHFADLLFRIANKKLISEKLSLQLKALLSMQLDKSKLAPGFPSTAMYSHKTGWWSYYTHDAGIVEDGKLKYVIAVFTPVKEENMGGRIQLLAQKIHAMMKRYTFE